ncbi:MAG: hypothetical protein JXN63_09325 [Candidatus Delongbacteria bacterium]|nr:hypothetical protein [Candidatus Delongbacteria bacterium]
MFYKILKFVSISSFILSGFLTAETAKSPFMKLVLPASEILSVNGFFFYDREGVYLSYPDVQVFSHEIRGMVTYNFY